MKGRLKSWQQSNGRDGGTRLSVTTSANWKRFALFLARIFFQKIGFNLITVADRPSGSSS
jgi:hypothetical protein